MSKIYDALKRAEREREIARDRGGRDNGHPVEPRGRRGTVARRTTTTGACAPACCSRPAYSDVRTIAVTATRHGEGATRVAVGLARALAAEGETRVLLVEAQPAHAVVRAAAADRPKGPGLAEFLAGEAERERRWSRRSATGTCR